jgi:hypothetical protein
MALMRALRDDARVEVRTDRRQRQSYECFGFMVLGLDYAWKVVVATLSVPLTRRARGNRF